MLVFALVAAAFAAGPPSSLPTSEVNHWTWRGPVTPGSALDIRGITGDIRALPSEDGQVEVHALIEKDVNVEMRVREGPNGVVVCAVREGSGACATDPVAGPGGRVDYELRVPSGVHLVARTVNGAIEADSLASDVHATTVNGPVVISTSGTAHASTVNGSIMAKLLKPFWSKAPSFSAVNGQISVVIPANVKTGIQAETRNGKIVKSLPAFRGAASEQKIDGTVGRGAGGCSPLIIRTINGQIDLKQRL